MATQPRFPELRPLSRGQHLARIWLHALQARPLQIAGSGLGLLVVVGALVLVPGLHPPATPLAESSDWVDWLEKIQTLFGLATLLVAVFVWYGELREDWTEQLPRLLTFAYFHDGLPALVCWHAYLPGEDDIRALAQQLGGRQMVREELQMRPVVDALPTQLLTDGRRTYLHHRVRLELTQVPDRFRGISLPEDRPAALVWHPRREPCPPETSAAVPAADALRELGGALWADPDGDPA